ncbi:MAG: hypothetical protein IIT33_00710, partial [Prevotella sp.]|nr:hypothetical protein [Prevotella sp.]
SYRHLHRGSKCPAVAASRHDDQPVLECKDMKSFSNKKRNQQNYTLFNRLFKLGRKGRKGDWHFCALFSNSQRFWAQILLI